MAIRVTDVQSLLRHYANLGHDVLSDPRAVHLDGKRYGMAVGHSLRIPRTFHGVREEVPRHNPDIPNTHFLETYIQQSERPLISHLRTYQIGRDAEAPYSFRAIAPLVPNINDEGNSYFNTHRNEGMHTSSANIPGFSNKSNNGGFWTPDIHDSYSQYDDPHEALESHLSGDVSHLGTVSDERYSSRDMEPEELRNFKYKDAVSNLITPHKPFSNLIHVYENDSVDDGKGYDNHYTYDPETEQLLPINK